MLGVHRTDNPRTAGSQRRQHHHDLYSRAERTMSWHAFLCVFGRRSHIAQLKLPAGAFAECGDAVFADFGKTRYGCRMYELPNNRIERDSGKAADGLTGAVHPGR